MGAGENLNFQELVARTRGLQPWRRIVHALNGLVLAALPTIPFLGREGTLWLLAVGSLLLLAVDAVRLRVPAVNAYLFDSLRSLASPREAGGLASSTWYLVGAFLTYAIFPLAVAIPAILVLALADPTASVVGRTWGRRPVGKGSLEGALAFFTVALAVLLLALGGGTAMVARALAVALVATTVEVAPLGDDNVSVPLGTGAALWLALAVG